MCSILRRPSDIVKGPDTTSAHGVTVVRVDRVQVKSPD